MGGGRDVEDAVPYMKYTQKAPVSVETGGFTFRR